MTQLTLALQPRRLPARQLPAIERLRAVLTRQGIDWRYRATRGAILFRPMFGPHFGWQLMCGRYCCQGAELALLSQGHPVRLVVLGRTHPPLMIGVDGDGVL